jgi:hypothetical protein
VLGALPGVALIERRADAFVLEARDGEDAARATGEAIQRRGWSIRELREETPDLEAIFLDLVGAGQRPP